jgi:hypothetical protein
MVRLRALTAAALSLTALGGCASTVSGTPSAGSAPVSRLPSTSAAGGTQSGAAIITQTFDAMESATAFRAVAHGTDGTGAALDIDAHFGMDSASGSINEDGLAIQVIVVGGNAYFKGDDTFLKHFIPAAQQAKALPLLHGKWVAGPASSEGFSEIADSFTRTAFVDSIRQGDPASDYSVIGNGTRSGTAVIRLRDSGDGSEVDVLASGPPLPIYSSTPVTSADGGGTVVFSDWNVAFSATKPPADDTFDATPYLH